MRLSAGCLGQQGLESCEDGTLCQKREHAPRVELGLKPRAARPAVGHGLPLQQHQPDESPGPAGGIDPERGEHLPCSGLFVASRLKPQRRRSRKPRSFWRTRPRAVPRSLTRRRRSPWLTRPWRSPALAQPARDIDSWQHRVKPAEAASSMTEADIERQLGEAGGGKRVHRVAATGRERNSRSGQRPDASRGDRRCQRALARDSRRLPASARPRRSRRSPRHRFSTGGGSARVRQSRP